jgi:serine/threonine-protein kinase
MNPSFSPDGRRVAFVTSTSPRSLRVATIAGGPVITLTDSLVDLGGVSWGHDGYIYFDAHLEGDGLARIREGGGTPEIATNPDSTAGEQYHVNPSALPDGRGILFSISRAGGGANWDIGVLDSRTRKHSVLVRGIQAVYAPSGHLLYVTSEGLLMAAPFDLDGLRITGEPVAMAEGVSVHGNGKADLSISDDGTLTYTSGAASGGVVEFVWVSRNGSVTQIDSSFAREFGSRPSLSPDGKALTARRGVSLDLGQAARSRTSVEGGSLRCSPALDARRTVHRLRQLRQRDARSR